MTTLVLQVVLTTAVILVAGTAAAETTTNTDVATPVKTTQRISQQQQTPSSSSLLIAASNVQPKQTKMPPRKVISDRRLIVDSDSDSEEGRGERLRRELMREGKGRDTEVGNERIKRKVIFGGGSYGHSGRRGGGAVGGDPYGRRSRHHGPDGRPKEYWNQGRRSGTPNAAPGTGANGPSNSQRATLRPDYVIISDPNHGNSRTSSAAAALGRIKPGASGTRRGSRGSDFSRKKLSKATKYEIAKFALQHGTQRAADEYGSVLGGKMAGQKIQKFIRRYQKHQKRNSGYHE